MESYIIDYWKESLSYSFDVLGRYEIWDSLPEEDKIKIAKDMQNSHECTSMSFGYIDTRVGDPEIGRLKSIIKDLEKEVQDWQDAFTKNVAMRRKCDKSDVSIQKDGNAIIY